MENTQTQITILEKITHIEQYNNLNSIELKEIFLIPTLENTIATFFKENFTTNIPIKIGIDETINKSNITFNIYITLPTQIDTKNEHHFNDHSFQDWLKETQTGQKLAKVLSIYEKTLIQHLKDQDELYFTKKFSELRIENLKIIGQELNYIKDLTVNMYKCDHLFSCLLSSNRLDDAKKVQKIRDEIKNKLLNLTGNYLEK